MHPPITVPELTKLKLRARRDRIAHLPQGIRDALQKAVRKYRNKQSAVRRRDRLRAAIDEVSVWSLGSGLLPNAELYDYLRVWCDNAYQGPVMELK
jgi:hypothetical protein